MSEHDNDNLERFFQKAAKDAHVEFNENDWLKLKARLDAEAPESSPTGPDRWRIGLSSASIILVFTGITYFVLPYNDQNKPNGSTADTQTITISKEKIVTPDRIGKQTQSTLPANQGLSTKSKSTTENRKRLLAVNPQKLINSYQHVQPEKETAESLLPSTQNEAQLHEVIDRGVPEPRLAEGKGNGVAVPFSSQEDSTKLPVPENNKPVIEKSEIAKGPDSVSNNRQTVPARWSIVFLFAPDFSSIGLRQYTSPGEAFGLVTHYHLNNTFSISTGLVISNKKYRGYGNDYKPPKGYWKRNTNGVIPEKVYGTCNVLEIPLAIQYKVANMKRSRVFITAGFSSYLMLDESYRYTFEYPNPGSKEGWNSSKTSWSFFSIANVSTGYERNISPHAAIGIEPYAKIPLTGIGWSGLKLFSLGASVTLRYSIPKKKY